MFKPYSSLHFDAKKADDSYYDHGILSTTNKYFLQVKLCASMSCSCQTHYFIMFVQILWLSHYQSIFHPSCLCKYGCVTTNPSSINRSYRHELIIAFLLTFPDIYGILLITCFLSLIIVYTPQQACYRCSIPRTQCFDTPMYAIRGNFIPRTILFEFR